MLVQLASFLVLSCGMQLLHDLSDPEQITAGRDLMDSHIFFDYIDKIVIVSI